MDTGALAPGDRILLVAPNISRRMGGEGLKALQIHLELRALGFAVRQVTHARVRAELERDYPDLDVAYLEDSALQVFLDRVRLGPLLTLLNAWQLNRLARREGARFAPRVIHVTSPISPVLPHFRLPGFATVIGPLNGNITHPPAFRAREGRGRTLSQALMRPAQAVFGRLFGGKRAAILLVSGGQRTEDALRLGRCDPARMVHTLDCGLPDAVMDRERYRQSGENRRFVFLGRLVRLKACDFAIRAVAAADPATTLDVIGDGPERPGLEALAASLGIADRIRFVGWVPPGPALYDRLAGYRGLVMPTLCEANGIAFQEAMALGIPIICLDWGGPQLLLAHDEAILIPPTGEAAVVDGLTAAMDRLGSDGAFADTLSARARTKAEALGFRWRELIGRWLPVYARAVAAAAGPNRAN